MQNLGITQESFNPSILYTIKRSFNSNTAVQYHSHDFCSLMYVLSGSCTYTIKDLKYRVEKGDLILLNPGVYHGKKIDILEDITELHIGFDNFNLKNKPKNFIIDENMSPVIKLHTYENDFYKCCIDIINEQEERQIGCGLILKSLVMKMIVIILRAIHTGDISNQENTYNFDPYDKVNLVSTILSYIDENYMKQISLDKIAKNMYLSPIYISKIFKEETNESPINYLIKKRLAKAKEILENGNYTIKETAKSVGYEDAYHFSKLFKKYYGASPSKYVKKNK